jgi:uncharacterized protein involved in exopolysaccharide biosynthesis
MVRGAFELSSSVAVGRGGSPRDLNIFDHVHVIYRYRWLILLVCILAAGVAGTLAYLSPARFVAKVSLVPPVQTGGDTSLGLSMLGNAGASLLRKVMDTTSAADMYVGILESQTVRDVIINRFDLVQVYGRGSSRDRTRRWLQKCTEIEVSKEGILSVTVEDADPNRAAAMANAYVEELDLQNKRLALGQVSNKRVFLEGRLKEVEQKLSRIDSIPTREAQVQEMLYELLMRELELAKIEEAKSLPTIQILDPAVPPEVRRPKGALGEAALTGVVAFVCVVFFAFAREYYLECGRWGQQDVSRPRDRHGLQGDATDRGDDRNPSLVADPG